MEFDKIVKNIINEEIEYYSSSKTKKPRQPSWKKTHNRIPSYKDLVDDYGCFMETEIGVEGIPLEAFPQEVIEKYKTEFNFTDDNIKKYGIQPDVFIGLDYDVEDNELSLSGDTIWKILEEQEFIFTAHSPKDQFEMNMAIEEAINKYIIKNNRRLEDLIEYKLRN